ncbi:MAG: hypothetical protein HY262_07825 [Chloroflexi bacterium]|nr:hypothetical protein [Chloroflexota bacterium]
MRVVVLGGSGASTPELFEALSSWPGGSHRRPALEFVLVGRSPDKLRVVGDACQRRAPMDGKPVTIEVSTNRRSSLEGADVVLDQVRIGGLASRAFDELFPREFGIPGEETMGPGGFANALRTVPALRATWSDIADVAPRSFVVNLTNPSGIVVAAARREFDIHIVSVCDSPMTHTAAIAARLGREVGRVRRRYVGLNHVGWYVPEHPDELVDLVDLAVGETDEDVAAQEAIGAPYVRFYLRPDAILAGQRGGPTRAEALSQLESELVDAYAAERTDSPRRGAGWYRWAVVPLVDAWTNGGGETQVIGLVGGPTLSGLPPGVMVEQPVDLPLPGRLRPLPVVALPRLPSAILAAHAAYEALTVDAILAGSPRIALIRALLANPLVPDAERAGRLVDRILSDSPRIDAPA